MWFFVVARTALQSLDNSVPPTITCVCTCIVTSPKELHEFLTTENCKVRKIQKQMSPYTCIWLCRNVFPCSSQFWLSHFQNFWDIYIFIFITWTKFCQFDWNQEGVVAWGFFPCSQTLNFLRIENFLSKCSLGLSFWNFAILASLHYVSHINVK